MGEFINTIDMVGENIFVDSFLLRTVTEFKENRVSAIGACAFSVCKDLVRVDCPNLLEIKSQAFSYTRSLKAVILRGDTICTIKDTSAFRDCNHILGTVDAMYNPDGLTDGYIYVPAALLDSYKAATNWSTYADQFRALEDYTVDGTITGELDENKI